MVEPCPSPAMASRIAPGRMLGVLFLRILKHAIIKGL